MFSKNAKRPVAALVALTLSILLLDAVPAQAGALQFADVAAQVMVDARGRSSVALYFGSAQQPASQSSSTGGGQHGNAAPSGDGSGASAPPTGGVTQAGGVTVETIQLGDVTGTICDCGGIPFLAGGGFPLWPLLGLGAVPVFFLGGNNDTESPPSVITPPPPTTLTPMPTPPTQQVPIPEPATILLFGSGLLALGAGARRRSRSRQPGNGICTREV